MMKIKIAVPSKGRISEPSINILEKAGLGLIDKSNRKLISKTFYENIEVMFARASDIPEFVNDGVADIGITGVDLIRENEADVCELLDLRFGQTKLVLAAPEESNINSINDITEDMKVATEFPVLTKKYLQEKGLDLKIVKLSGSTEAAPFIGIADLITDLTSTGTTLKMNHLEIIEIILESSIKLIANHDSLKEKRELIEAVSTSIKGVLDADRKKLIMMNVDEIDLNKVKEVMPSMGGLTISEVLSVKIFKLKNIISIKDFEREDIEYILDEASKLEDIAQSKAISDELKGKVLGLMFFEPSTRTRISFETAMKRFNGQCIGFASSDSSSVSKGESIADTAKMFEAYSDALVIRHELEGVSKFISDIVDVPVINAGDGAGQHPTQTLLDLYTIRNEIGSIDNLNIALIGDLKFGRTVHSLAQSLTLFNNIKIYLVSPQELRMPQEILHDLNKTNVEYVEVDSIEDIIDEVDVLYVTRIQKERFVDIDDYLKIKGAYIINKKMLEGKDLIVMHPLPRIDEIAGDVDDTKYNKYFKQAANAVPVRMAILKTLIKNNPK